MRLAFLGMGVMGAPMAGHLLRAGHTVRLFNRTRSKAEAVADAAAGSGGNRPAVCDTPRDAAAGAAILFVCVSADADVLDVVTGASGALEGAAAGAILVDHSTVSAATARALADACGQQGLGFLDAPVSGGQAGAENGQLTIMAGGDPAAFEIASPVMQAYARQMKLLGGAGAGQAAKMVNQVCIAGILQGLAEALALANAAGLDAADVISVIQAGAAGSWQMENRAHTMIRGEFDFGFAVDLMRKDLGIVLSEAKALGISLPLTALVDQFYADVQAMGGGRQDTSSLIRRFSG